MKLPYRNIVLGACAVAVIGVAYTALQNPPSLAEATQQAPQAMPVIVTVAKKEPVTIWKEFSGHMEAVDYAEIRPQVSGTITEIRFEDGQSVKKGDVLFVIDPRPYQATIEQANADVAAAEADLEFAKTEAERAEKLIKTDAISQSVLDERKNAQNVAKASLEAAKARQTQAQINLDFAFVTAPITGRLSRAEITEGNLVEAGPNAPVLTSIVSNDGIYAGFEVNERTYISSIRSVARDKDAEKKIPVKVELSGDDTIYEGFIHSFDNRIESSSGTIRARALFKNEDGAMLPGMYAKVMMGQAAAQDQILISEKAIGTNQDRKFVYVVSDENITAYREVNIGESINGKRVILSGLEEGDKVITEGIIRIQPDLPVIPQEAEKKKTL